MGEQTTDPAGRHYYADPTPTDNGPPVELELAPFFMSKYELTQAQWLRAAGVNPSKYGPLYAERLPDELGADVATHPVDSLSWVDAARIARDLGLELPTETQWEYAARAGTDTTWWTGDDRDSLVGAANLGDQALMRTQTDSAVGEASAHDWPELDDGFGIHSRVDALKANPFGLHGMVGNLWEWCRDSWGPLFDPARAGDGLRAGRDERQAAVRGGSFEGTAASARSANRAGVSRDQRHHVLGARPARAIDP